MKPKKNLIFLGSVGTGKTHLATAIALKACHQGRCVRFFTAAALANLLLERNNKGTLNAFLGTLRKTELLVIDEIGFVPLHKDAAELLFQVISDCYERKSLIITSNLEFSQWNTVFGDNRLTAALIDRLIFHSHIVIFSGESYRLTQSMNRQRVGVWKSSVRNTSATVVASRSSLTDARILYAGLLQYLRTLFFFHSALPRVLFIGFKEF